MALSVDWVTKIITVPQADLTSLGGGFYELDLDAFRTEIAALQESEEGIVFDTIINYTSEYVLGSITLASVVQLINGYTVTFEDGSYGVNLVGANSNVLDVTNLNQVSIRAQNSAGLIVTAGGGGGGYTPAQISDAVWDELLSGHTTSGTTGKQLQLIVSKLNAILGLV